MSDFEIFVLFLFIVNIAWMFYNTVCTRQNSRDFNSLQNAAGLLDHVSETNQDLMKENELDDVIDCLNTADRILKRV